MKDGTGGIDRTDEIDEIDEIYGTDEPIVLSSEEQRAELKELTVAVRTIALDTIRVKLLSARSHLRGEPAPTTREDLMELHSRRSQINWRLLALIESAK